MSGAPRFFWKLPFGACPTTPSPAVQKFAAASAPRGLEAAADEVKRATEGFGPWFQAKLKARSPCTASGICAKSEFSNLVPDTSPKSQYNSFPAKKPRRGTDSTATPPSSTKPPRLTHNRGSAGSAVADSGWQSLGGLSGSRPSPPQEAHPKPFNPAPKEKPPPRPPNVPLLRAFWS